jgi:hypothetical protein
VELYYRTSQRLLVLRFPDGRDRIFRPALGAKPDLDEGWSNWRKVDFVGLPDQAQAVKPGPEDTSRYATAFVRGVRNRAAAADEGHRRGSASWLSSYLETRSFDSESPIALNAVLSASVDGEKK